MKLSISKVLYFSNVVLCATMLGIHSFENENASQAIGWGIVLLIWTIPVMIRRAVREELERNDYKL